MILKRAVLFMLVLFSASFIVIVLQGANEDVSTTSPDSQNTQKGSTQKNETKTSKCKNGQKCTLAEVSTHNTSSDCWVIYESKVYDVTSYANSHPGGARAFDTSTCGDDIAAQIDGQASSDSLGGRSKNHSMGDLSELSNFYVGDLQ